VRKVSSLALLAYLASAASIASLQNTIFESVRPSEDEMLGVYLSKWQSMPVDGQNMAKKGSTLKKLLENVSWQFLIL